MGIIFIRKKKTRSKNVLPSNKAVRRSRKRRNENIAYKDSNYYITIPFIDKIAICADPPNLNQEEKKQLNSILYYQAKCKEEGNNPESPVELMTLDKKHWAHKYYKYSYKITPPYSKEFITLFFGPRQKDQRFLRIEMNPRKLGRKNVKWFIRWYNNDLMHGHSRFQDAVSVPKCISYLHIAIDIVGIHISELMLNENKGKTMRWHAENGLLETCYLKAKAGHKPSNLKIYDKYAEETTKAYNDNDYTYGRNIPVTRIEVAVETKHALTDLLALRNKFKHLIIGRLNISSYLKPFIPEEMHNLELFLDSVRAHGKEEAIRKIPRHLQAKYRLLLNRGIENIFSEYNDSGYWSRYWGIGLKKSGLLYED